MCIRDSYEGVRAFKAPYLRQAYQVFQKKNGTETDEYKEFVSMEWVYAVSYTHLDVYKRQVSRQLSK